MSRASSKGTTSIGVDIGSRGLIIAAVRQSGRRTSLTNVTHLDTPLLIERDGYRDPNMLGGALQEILQPYTSSSPRVSVGSVRARTLMTTVRLQGLNKQKATTVLKSQASRHFSNPGELSLAVDTADIEPPARGKKRSTDNWLVAAIPTEHLNAIREVEEAFGTPIGRYEPKALASLRAALPALQGGEDHLILSGGNDGSDLTVILGGTIELVRLIGPDFEKDILPELNRTLDYVRSEDRPEPTLHLAIHADEADRLKDDLGLQNVNILTPWDDLFGGEEIQPEALAGAATAIGLALGGLA